MRMLWIIGAAAAGLAGGAQAQELDIEHAAARVVVIPEARGDVAVQVAQGAANLPPLEVRRRGASIEIDGGLKRRIQGCQSHDRGGGSVATVHIKDIGHVQVSQLPTITARVPLNTKVSAGGAVYGSVGRTRALDLGASGCGDWTVANVEGPMTISVAGSGDVSTGTSRSADINVAGSGDVRVGHVAGPLDASIAGSGDVRAASVAGKIDVSIAGSGDVVVASGRSGALNASIMGSGDVRVDGQVESVDASVAGSGDVQVAGVRGGVSQSILGSGSVSVAGQRIARRR